jgi:hypothetical protein
MSIRLFAPRRARPHRRRPSCRPGLEQLETRNLLSGPTPIPEVEPNDSLNLAQSIGALDNTTAIPIVARIGNGAAGAADVDWYSFTLSGPGGHVHISATANDSANLDAVLGLYNNDPGNTFDPTATLTGHRLMAQVVGANGVVTLDRDLGAGTYFVAVSGKGNQYFYPLMPNSGLNGETGGYLLQATGTPLSNPGSILLSSDLDNITEHDGSGNPVLHSSPLVLHFDTNGLMDPASDIHLFDSNGVDMPISFNIDSTANELQIMPVQALAPSPNPYQVVAFNFDDSVVQFTASFVVAGVEGNDNGLPDDVVGNAHDLGDATGGQILQATGAIGVDPFYDPINFAGDPNRGNPANQVDLYRFHVGGTGQYALAAEVFAGRIGSLLDPALTVFRVNPNGPPVLIAGNDNTGNSTPAQLDVGQVYARVPLLTDAAVFAALQPGDYIVAVSSRINYADPVIGRHIGQNGTDPTQLVFDPTVSHSGTLGGGPLGPYVLNLRVQPAQTPPQVVSAVVSSATSSGTAVAGYPTDLDVRFSGPINMRQLAFQAFEQNLPADLTPVFIQDASGNSFVPRLTSFNDTTYDAHFILLDRLATGTYQLHLSGARGLTDFSGNPLLGNTPGGDFVVPFTVIGAPALNLHVATQLGNDDPAHFQDLGVVFGHEFEQQFVVGRNFTASQTDPNDTADFYTFQVLQGANYSFFLQNVNGSVSSPDLVDAAGNTIVPGARGILNVHLDPGTYHLRVAGWTQPTAAGTTYDLVFSVGTVDENPTPLTTGPVPALRLQLVGNVPLPPPPAPPILILPVPPSSIAPASADTNGTGSGLTALLPGLANALAAGPVGGIRGPATATDGGPQVVLLNLAPPTLAIVESPSPYTDLGGADDDMADNLFNRITQMSLQARDLLFGGDILFRSVDGGSSEDQEPKPAPDDQGDDEAVAAPADAATTTSATDETKPGGDADLIWTAALGFVGLPLGGSDRKARRWTAAPQEDA